jgi:streptogramin lyase
MKQERRVLSGLLALSLLLASGCQAPMQLHQLKQPLFAVGQADHPVPALVVGHPSAASGQLTVRFDGELARLSQGRRIQATVADVEKVVVTVTPANGAAVSQTVLKAELNNGQTSVTFNGLPPGDATITITAFDAANANIGSTTRTATVTVGQVATLDVALQLSPTIVSSGGGSSSPTTGGLTTNVTLQDGAVVQNLPDGGVVETFAMPFHPWEIASNGRDDIWVTGSNSESIVLAKIAPTGAIERLITNVGDLTGSVCVDADGDAWVTARKPDGGYVLAEYDAAGAQRQQIDLSEEHASITHVQMRMDPQGGVYFFGGPDVGGSRQAPDGTVTHFNTTGTTGTPGTLNDVWVGIIDDPAVAPMTATSLVVRFSNDGTELGRYDVGAGYRSAYTAIDQQGNAWVTAMESALTQGDPTLNGRLVKFSPQGQELGVFEISNGKFANAVEIGADGRVWVVSGGGSSGTVTWFSSAGVELGNFTLAQVHPWRFAATSNGAWVIGGSSGRRDIVHIAP